MESCEAAESSASLNPYAAAQFSKSIILLLIKDSGRPIFSLYLRKGESNSSHPNDNFRKQKENIGYLCPFPNRLPHCLLQVLNVLLFKCSGHHPLTG